MVKTRKIRIKKVIVFCASPLTLYVRILKYKTSSILKHFEGTCKIYSKGNTAKQRTEAYEK